MNIKLKKAFLNIVFACSILSLFYLHFSKSEKIAYVNEITVNQKYQGMIDAMSLIEKKSKSLQINLDSLSSELQQDIAAYEKKRQKLSENEISLSEQLLSSKRQQIIQYQDAVQKKLQDEHKAIIMEVSSKMNLFLERYAKSKNYKLVLGSSVLYGNSEIDITEEIILGLNDEYKKGKH